MKTDPIRTALPINRSHDTAAESSSSLIEIKGDKINLYLIAIQPDEADPNNINMKKMEKLIKGKGNPCHLFGYTWLAKTPLDPTEFTNHLKRWLNPNDKYIV